MRPRRKDEEVMLESGGASLIALDRFTLAHSVYVCPPLAGHFSCGSDLGRYRG